MKCREADYTMSNQMGMQEFEALDDGESEWAARILRFNIYR